MCGRFLASEGNLRERERSREDGGEKYREFAEGKERYNKVKTMKAQGSSERTCGQLNKKYKKVEEEEVEKKAVMKREIIRMGGLRVQGKEYGNKSPKRVE